MSEGREVEFPSEDGGICWKTTISRAPNRLHLAGVEKERVQLSREIFRQLAVVNQVDRKFISCRAEDGHRKYLILIDQHAAHERILLEKFIRRKCVAAYRFAS